MIDEGIASEQTVVSGELDGEAIDESSETQRARGWIGALKLARSNAGAEHSLQ